MNTGPDDLGLTRGAALCCLDGWLILVIDDEEGESGGGGMGGVRL